MAIADTVQSIKTHLGEAYSALEEKQATIPGNKNIENLADSILSVPSGGGEKEFTGHYDTEGLKAIGYDDDTIKWYQDNGVVWNEELDDYFKLNETELTGYNTNLTRYIPKNTTITNFTNYRRLITIPKLKFNHCENLFNYCYSLPTIPLIDISGVESLAVMFAECYSIDNIPLLDTSSATSMRRMFLNCRTLTKISNFNTQNVTTMFEMFSGCNSLQTIPQLDTNQVTDMGSMFSSCNSLKTIPQLNTSSVTNMASMFTSCGSLQTIPQLDTNSVTSMSNMFYNCYSFKKIPNFNTQNVTTMSSMFYGCYSIDNIPQLNTSSVTNMASMFYNCTSLKTIPQIDTSKVTNMGNMFNSCGNLTNVPILDASCAVAISSIFNGCSYLTNLGGLKDLGKAYLTSASANYSNYTLTLSTCTRLTHDSLMNVINNLYDIASAGVQPQKLTLGVTNLNKISAEEKAIATNKGWVLS